MPPAQPRAGVSCHCPWGAVGSLHAAFSASASCNQKPQPQGPSVAISGPEAPLVVYSSVRGFLKPSLPFPLAPVLSGLVALARLFPASSLSVTSASDVQTLYYLKQRYPLTKTPSGTSIATSDSQKTA